MNLQCVCDHDIAIFFETGKKASPDFQRVFFPEFRRHYLCGGLTRMAGKFYLLRRFKRSGQPNQCEIIPKSVLSGRS